MSRVLLQAGRVLDPDGVRSPEAVFVKKFPRYRDPYCLVQSSRMRERTAGGGGEDGKIKLKTCGEKMVEMQIERVTKVRLLGVCKNPKVEEFSLR